MSKPAAIWCRVSTVDQKELSPDSQEAACRRLLAQRGIAVLESAVFKVDWTSMELGRCPEFQALERLVQRGEIGALAVLDRDRLQAQGLQRLTFLSLCREAGVELLTCQGPGLIDGPEGQLVELALAIGKERQVQRARDGARDGMRDRVQLRHIPATPLAPVGYRFDEEAKQAGRYILKPTDHLATVRRIFNEYLAGRPIRQIAAGLNADGIPTPRTAKTGWGTSFVYYILGNPVYSGCYYALRWRTIEPKTRKGGYGKVNRENPPEQWLHLPDVVVQEPVITREAFDSIRGRMAANKATASRNAHRPYLLRGRISCKTCDRPMAAKWRKDWNWHEYWCRGCHVSRKGDRVDESVWNVVTATLLDPDRLAHAIARRSSQVSEEKPLRRELATREQALKSNASKRQEAFRLLLAGAVDQDVYDREVALMRAQETWLKDEISRITARLTTLARAEQRAEELDEFRRQFATILDETTPDQRRAVLVNRLNVQVYVEPERITAAVEVPSTPVDFVYKKARSSERNALALMVTIPYRLGAANPRGADGRFGAKVR